LEFKSIGQDKCFKKFNKYIQNEIETLFLLKIYKKLQKYIAKIGKNYYNNTQEMLPDKFCISKEA